MIKIIRVFLLGLSFTPLISDTSIFVPENGSFFIRSIILLLSLFFIINFIFKLEFRNNIIIKVKILIKNPLVLSIFIFTIISIISTIFAVDKYSAFWGNTTRVEGLVGLIYFFTFFIFSLFIFIKKDWFNFFKLSLITTSIILLKEFIQFFSGITRPDSFLGNPTFLAGYLLFSIFCSIIILSEIKNKFWKYFSAIIFILSILGIFMTETRGTLLGLFLGVISILIYGIITGKNIFYKKLNLRKLSIIFLFLFLIFSGVFISTRKSETWQKIPGFSRIAVIGNTDSTTQTRLLMGKLSLNAVNPIENGLKKFLIGWGPDNFSLAYAKYFDPLQFKYEKDWFDRSHNKLFDCLVMTGILGLLAYLMIWFLFFKSIFKNKDFSLINIGLLFFGVSLLVHFLFVFDQITTTMSFFVVLPFLIYTITNYSFNNKIRETEIVKKVFFGIFILILSTFLIFVYLKNDLPAFVQMKEYISLRQKNNLSTILDSTDRLFEPFTTAQMKIRYDFLFFMNKIYDPKNEYIVRLSEISFLRGEEYIQKVPLDLQFMSILAYNYTNQGKDSNNLEYLKKGEEYLRRVILYAPERPDFNYVLALNLFYQKRYNESFDLSEKLFETNPEYFSQNNTGSAEWFYTQWIKYFYDMKDKNNFEKVSKRLKNNGYKDSATLDQIIDFINKNNFWPSINFKK